MEKSKSQKAMDLMDSNPGMSQYRASRLLGMSPSTLSRAVASAKRKGRKFEALKQGGYFETEPPSMFDTPSRTGKAIALLKENPGMRVKDAALEAGVGVRAVQEARRRLRRTEGIRCKHCGGVLRYLRGVISHE